MNIGYKLVKNNMPATAEKAPYLGMAIPVGSLAYDNILREMIDNGTKMSLATARYFLEAFYDYAAKKIAADTVRINTGTVAIYPMIDGSFDSEDAEFDPERNSLYVGATLSQSLRDRVAGIVPDSSGEDAGGTVKMDRIYDLESQTRGVISGTSPFRISGRNLTVPDAEDESLALYAKDGVTKVTDITVTETDGGQLITCQLAATVSVPKGTYKVRIASHGLDPTDPLTVAMLTVTLVEAVTPPAPTLTRVSSRACDEGEVTLGDEFVLMGTGLDQLDSVTVEVKNGAGETTGSRTVEKADFADWFYTDTSTATDLFSSKTLVDWCALVGDGDAVTFTVRSAGGSATLTRTARAAE